MLAGYARAVLVATLVTLTIFIAPSMLPDGGTRGSFFGFLRGFPAMLGFGLAMTATHAFPGWLATVSLAEWRRIVSVYYFAAGGIFTAFLAVAIMGGERLNLFASPSPLLLAAMVGGACGGLAYWRLAGRGSGAWRKAKGGAFAVALATVKENPDATPAA
jgi:hypothetical protein